MRNRGLLGLTLFMAVGLALLIWLGVWQLNRLDWKDGLITRIETRSQRKPMTLDEAIAKAKEVRDPSYFRVHAEGRFHHAQERHLYAFSLEGEPGWHVITPLQTVDGEVVLVDRGFVPPSIKDPSSRALGQITGVVSVTGLVRMGEQGGIFTPDNDAQKNRWFSRDLPGMARSMFPSGTIQVAPFFIEADDSNVPGGWPDGGQTRLQIPNNHLQYAITWFSLAAALAILYGVYVHRVYRREKR
ncbi:MAG: SURF1 family protein [Methyloceanibacter sp.]